MSDGMTAAAREAALWKKVEKTLQDLEELLDDGLYDRAFGVQPHAIERLNDVLRPFGLKVVKETE